MEKHSIIEEDTFFEEDQAENREALRVILRRLPSSGARLA